MGTSCRNDLYRGSEAELPIEAAKRELEEEMGYVSEHWLELGSFYSPPGSTTEEIFLFAAAGFLVVSSEHRDVLC